MKEESQGNKDKIRYKAGLNVGKGTKDWVESKNSDTLGNILDKAVEMLGASGGGIYRHNKDAHLLELVVHRNRPKEFCIPIPDSQGVCGRIIQKKQDYLVVDEYDTSEYKYKEFPEGNFASFVAVLIRDKGEPIGAMFVEDLRTSFFSEEGAQKLMPLARSCRGQLVNESRHPQQLVKIDSEIVANAPMAIIAAEDGKVKAFNWKAQSLFGWSRGDIIDQDLTQLYADKETAKLMGDRLRKNGTLSNVTAEGRHQSKGTFKMRMSAVMLDGQRSVGYIESSEDMDASDTLLACTTALLETSNLREGLEKLASELVRALKVPVCNIYMLDKEFQVFNLVVSEGIISEMQVKSKKLASILKRNGLVFSSAGSNSSEIVAILGLDSVKCGALVPLQEMMGLMTVGYHEEYHQEGLEQLRKVVVLVARQISSFIRRLNLETEQRETNERLSSMVEASSSLLEVRAPVDLLEESARKLHELSGAWWTSIMVVNRKGDTQEFYRYGVDNHPKKFIQSRNNKGLTIRIIEDKADIIVSDTLKEDRFKINPKVVEVGVKAVLGLPLIYKGKCLGAAWIHFNKKRKFSAGELDSFRLFLNQLAVAYDAAYDRQLQEDVLKAVTELDQAHSLQTIETRFLKSARQLLGVPRLSWRILRVDNQRAEAHRLRFYPYQAKDPFLADFKAMKKLLHGTNDLKNKPFWHHRLKKTLAIGFHITHKTLGLLLLESSEEEYIHKRYLNALKNLVRHATFALNKTHINQNLEHEFSLVETATNLDTPEHLNLSLVQLARQLRDQLGCRFVSLSMWDETEKRLRTPYFTGRVDKEKAPQLNEDLRKILTKRVIRTGKVLWVKARKSKLSEPLKDFMEEKKVSDVIAYPLRSKERLEGVVAFGFSQKKPLDYFGEDATRMLARRTGYLVGYARLLAENEAQKRALKSLSKAGKDAIESLEMKRVLEGLAHQGIKLVPREKKIMHGVEIWIAEGTKLRVAAHQGRELVVKEMDIPKGIEPKYMVQQCFVERRSLYLANTHNIPEELKFCDATGDTRAELSIPIYAGKKVIGVLNVEHARRNGLEGLQEVFEALADHASIAIQCAQLYQTLEEVGAYIGDHTATEWLSLLGAQWGHDVNSSVAKAKMTLQIIAEDLEGLLTEEHRSLLNKAKDQLSAIGDIPLVAPLASEEEVGAVSLEYSLREYFEGSWYQGHFDGIELRLEFKFKGDLWVWASANWLVRIYEIVAKNAARALRKGPSGTPLTFRVVGERVGKMAIVRFRDNGPGVPRHLRKKVTEQTVSVKEGSQGSGFGLVIAGVIARKYKGDLFLNQRVWKGSEFVLTLPIYTGVETEDGNV